MAIGKPLIRIFIAEICVTKIRHKIQCVGRETQMKSHIFFKELFFKIPNKI